jgi:hypothetical protein
MTTTATTKANSTVLIRLTVDGQTVFATWRPIEMDIGSTRRMG